MLNRLPTRFGLIIKRRTIHHCSSTHVLTNPVVKIVRLYLQALQEGARLQSALSQQLSALERAQRNYEKAFREAERAEDAYRKADADLNLSRADVEKQRINSSIKSHQCDDNKNEYAKQLQKANELQIQHYQVCFCAYTSVRVCDYVAQIWMPWTLTKYHV